MPLRIALTGATGFVGRAVLPALLEAGHEISILVRQPEKHSFPIGVKVVQGDLQNNAALTELMRSSHCVVHVAGAISALSERNFFAANVDGVRAVYTAAEAAGVRRFVQVSSLAARQPELSPYALSKRAGEDILRSEMDNMSIVILRPSAIYGPGDRATLPLLAALQKKAAFIPSTAKSRFSLLHVRDFADVIAQAVASDAKGEFEIDDLSGGHDWAELAALNKISSGLPQRLKFLPFGIVYVAACFAELWSKLTQRPGMVTRAKLRELYHEDWVVKGTNWARPNPIGLAEGLAETLNWYRQHGWLAKSQDFG